MFILCWLKMNIFWIYISPVPLMLLLLLLIKTTWCNHLTHMSCSTLVSAAHPNTPRWAFLNYSILSDVYIYPTLFRTHQQVALHCYTSEWASAVTCYTECWLIRCNLEHVPLEWEWLGDKSPSLPSVHPTETQRNYEFPLIIINYP